MNSSKIGMCGFFITFIALMVSIYQCHQSDEDNKKKESKLNGMSIQLEQVIAQRDELKEKINATNKMLTALKKVSRLFKQDFEAAQKKTDSKLSGIHGLSTDTIKELHDFILEYESSIKIIENLKQALQHNCDGFCDEKSHLYKELVSNRDALKKDHKDKIKKLNGLVYELNEEYDANRLNPNDLFRSKKIFIKDVYELFPEFGPMKVKGTRID